MPRRPIPYAEGGEIRDPSSHRTPEQIKRMDRGYNATPVEIKRREERNQNRAEFIREGKVRKGDYTDIDHHVPLAKGGSNDRSNLRVLDRSANRRKSDKLPK